MSSEQFERRRSDREHAPARNEDVERGEAVQTIAEPFAAFGRHIDAQLLELEACHVLVGALPRHVAGTAMRRRMVR